MYRIEKINNGYFVMRGEVKVSERLKKEEAYYLIDKIRSIVKFR